MSASTSTPVPQLHYARNAGTAPPQPIRGPSFKASLYLVVGGIFVALFLKYALHSVPEVSTGVHQNMQGSTGRGPQAGTRLSRQMKYPLPGARWSLLAWRQAPATHHRAWRALEAAHPGRICTHSGHFTDGQSRGYPLWDEGKSSRTCDEYKRVLRNSEGTHIADPEKHALSQGGTMIHFGKVEVSRGHAHLYFMVHSVAVHHKPDFTDVVQVVNRLRKAHVQSIIKDFGPGVPLAFALKIALGMTSVCSCGHLGAMTSLLPCRV